MTTQTTPTPELVALLALVEEIDATETVPATAHPDCNALIKMIDIDDWHTLRDWFRSTRAATVPQGVSKDCARLDWVVSNGAVLCGNGDAHWVWYPRTDEVQEGHYATPRAAIDAAMTPPPAELGKGS